MPHYMLLGIPGTYDAMPNEHLAYPKPSEDEDKQEQGSVGITFKGKPDFQSLDVASARRPCLSQLDNIL